MYKAKNGKWYSHKESKAEYSCRKVGECVKDAFKSTGKQAKSIVESAKSPSDLFLGIAIAAVVWSLILF